MRGLFSELTGKQDAFKPKRDPSKKIHIYRAGQVPGWDNDEEKIEAPPAKPKKGKTKAALERARAEAEGDVVRRVLRVAPFERIACSTLTSALTLSRSQRGRRWREMRVPKIIFHVCAIDQCVPELQNSHYCACVRRLTSGSDSLWSHFVIP